MPTTKLPQPSAAGTKSTAPRLRDDYTESQDIRSRFVQLRGTTINIQHGETPMMSGGPSPWPVSCRVRVVL